MEKFFGNNAKDSKLVYNACLKDFSIMCFPGCLQQATVQFQDGDDPSGEANSHPASIRAHSYTPQQACITHTQNLKLLTHYSYHLLIVCGGHLSIQVTHKIYTLVVCMLLYVFNLALCCMFKCQFIHSPVSTANIRKCALEILLSLDQTCLHKLYKISTDQPHYALLNVIITQVNH